VVFEQYREWASRLKPTLRQVHVAGEKVLVDYSGHTLEVIEVVKMRSVQIFAAVLGVSKYTYAEASFSQSLPDWIASRLESHPVPTIPDVGNIGRPSSQASVGTDQRNSKGDRPISNGRQDRKTNPIGSVDHQ
jgi:hypothetical protein